MISDDDKNEDDVNIPYGFWRRFIEEDLNLAPSNSRRMRAIRALKAQAVRAYQSCKTRMSARGLRHGNSKRFNGVQPRQCYQNNRLAACVISILCGLRREIDVQSRLLHAYGEGEGIARCALARQERALD